MDISNPDFGITEWYVDGLPAVITYDTYGMFADQLLAIDSDGDTFLYLIMDA